MTLFEKRFAEYIGAKYAVSYCNGTAALHAASYACGADSNSIFISSIYSYHGTILSLLENRSKVILVDYEDDYIDDNYGENPVTGSETILPIIMLFLTLSIVCVVLGRSKKGGEQA